MLQQKILIVEDDPNISDFLQSSLKEEGYIVKATADGAEAIKIIKENNIDLVVLDLGLENISGETVCIAAKKHSPDLPIIILTAKNTSQDIVKGLNIGADDYMSKPFEIEELLARIRTRMRVKNDLLIRVSDLTFNSKSMEVKRAGKDISLTAKEFKLLEYLLVNKGVVLTRESILDRIWLYSPEVDTRVVDVYVGYLRKKIDSGSSKKLIHSVRGFGYVVKE